ncbi:MAG TPA: hypothetical protein VGE67_10190 [Haloferula sp.]
MYVAPSTFDCIATYLDGYQACCAVNGLEDPFDGLRELIQCRVGRQCATHWTHAIRHFFAASEEAAVPLIFASIHDLHRIKEEKGLEWLKSEFERMKHLQRARPMNPSWPFKA